MRRVLIVVAAIVLAVAIIGIAVYFNLQVPSDGIIEFVGTES